MLTAVSYSSCNICETIWTPDYCVVQLCGPLPDSWPGRSGQTAQNGTLVVQMLLFVCGSTRDIIFLILLIMLKFKHLISWVFMSCFEYINVLCITCNKLVIDFFWLEFWNKVYACIFQLNFAPLLSGKCSFVSGAVFKVVWNSLQYWHGWKDSKYEYIKKFLNLLHLPPKCIYIIPQKRLKVKPVQHSNPRPIVCWPIL